MTKGRAKSRTYVGIPESKQNRCGGNFDGYGDSVGVEVVPSDDANRHEKLDVIKYEITTDPSAKPRAGSAQRAAK